MRDQQFSAFLREFERVVARITKLREELNILEYQRDKLRRQLRSQAIGPAAKSEPADTDTQGSSPVVESLQNVPEAIRLTVEAVKTHGGPATASDIAALLEKDE